MVFGMVACGIGMLAMMGGMAWMARRAGPEANREARASGREERVTDAYSEH